LLKLVDEAYGANVAVDRYEDFKIDRSLDSSLYRDLTGFTPPSWEEMVERMADDPTPYENWRK
jgi:dTDP-4-dehydrorhamnose reductase